MRDLVRKVRRRFALNRLVAIRGKVWIGLNTIIVKGVTLGEGSVVAAGSVGIRDAPPYALVAGNPARVGRDLER